MRPFDYDSPIFDDFTVLSLSDAIWGQLCEIALYSLEFDGKKRRKAYIRGKKIQPYQPTTLIFRTNSGMRSLQ